ncbi:MAG: radical SAM protein [Candidatus ainarchaeum sp.]|nr:radical SAM protein [Candidatus ainarchaeum sp.]
MKITLLNVFSEEKHLFNKDVMGGYGESLNIGRSMRAKIIERLKSSGVKLPLLSFGYLAGIFEKKGFEVEFRTNSIPEDSGLVIVSSSIVDCKTELAWIERIKKETKSRVGVIGPFAGAVPDFYLKKADFVVSGEPEQFALSLKKGEKPKGIIKSRPVAGLDSLPFPAWKFFPVKEYSYYPLVKKKPFLPIASSRGCNFQCNYCPYRAHYGNSRMRSVENTLSEIKRNVSEFGMKGMLFRDPLFTVNKKRSAEIADGIIKNKLGLEWGCETRLDCLDIPLLEKLYEAGLRSLNIGIESSDSKILESASRKPIEIKHQESMIEHCGRLGIKVSAFYILGLPDDTEKSIRRTIEYAKKLDTHIAQFFICTPFPGTEFFEETKKSIFEKDWEKFDSFTPVFRHKNLSPEQILALKEKAFQEYYFRPSYMAKFLARNFFW